MKIPPHATRVFKGQIFDVYQWEQELFDGTKTIFEGLKRPNTVVVIALQKDGDILYAKQEQPGKAPFKSLFGGQADDGEEPIDTAKRELAEETGLASDDWQLLREYTAKGKIQHNVYYFLARNCHKVSEQSLDSGEKIEVLTASIEDFISNILPDPNFAEHELRQEVFSAFNDKMVQKLKQEILGE